MKFYIANIKAGNPPTVKSTTDDLGITVSRTSAGKYTLSSASITVGGAILLASSVSGVTAQAEITQDGTATLTLLNANGTASDTALDGTTKNISILIVATP